MNISRIVQNVRRKKSFFFFPNDYKQFVEVDCVCFERILHQHFHFLRFFFFHSMNFLHFPGSFEVERHSTRILNRIRIQNERLEFYLKRCCFIRCCQSRFINRWFPFTQFNASFEGLRRFFFRKGL